MARKNQQLINYHSSGKTSMPNLGDVQYGEIVVRHNPESPELLIKVSGSTGEQFATFIDSEAVRNSITGASSELSSKVEAISAMTIGLSGSVIDNYATSANTHNAIATAKGEAISAASATSIVAKGEAVDAASALTHSVNIALGGRIDSNDSLIQNLQASASSLETKFNDYATSADTHSAIATAKSDAITSGASYADAKKTEAIAAASAYTKQQFDILSGSIDTVKSDVSTLSGNAHSAIATLSGNVQNAISQSIASVYRVKGSKNTYADLPGTGNETGDVWNVISANTETDTPAGTNYVWNGTAWDALGGSINMEPYALKSEVDPLLSGLRTDVNHVSGLTIGLSGSVVNNYATSADTHSAIATAKGEAISAASATSIVAKGEAVDAASALTHNVNTALTQSIQTTNGRIDTVSAALSGVSAVTVTAVQTVDFSGTTAEARTASASGAKVSKIGTDVKLDLSSLVIDCGEF